jgi:hypothetical protein
MNKAVAWRLLKKLGVSGYRFALAAARMYVKRYDANPMRGAEKRAYAVAAITDALKSRGIHVPEWVIGYLVEAALAKLRIEQGRL